MANASPRARRRRESGGDVPSYSPDDENIVKRILRCNDNHYAVLNLTSKCTADDVKKSYRLLVLAVHPDKNKHPDAKTAFEAIKKASDVLSDPAQRKQYDDGAIIVREALNQFFRAQAQARARAEEARRSRGWHEEWTEEETFTFPPRTETRRPRPSPTFTPTTFPNDDKPYLVGAIIIAFFVILYFAISLYIGSVSIGSFAIYNDQSYSFLKVGQYQLQRKTSELKVPFYIKSNTVTIGSTYEKTVERDYLSRLKANCDLERAYKRNTGFQHLTTPSCGIYRRDAWMRGI